MNTVNIIIFLIVIACLIGFIVFYARNPFQFPYIVIHLDITGRRQPRIDDVIDEYLNNGGFEEVEVGYERLINWKKSQKARIPTMLFSKHRMKQYKSVLTDKPCIVILSRTHTRYQQRNYQKYAYTVDDVAGRTACSYKWMRDRYDQLKAIGNECTLQEYNSKEQRKLMTPALRKKIMIRDNYTCQICGKYMPDGVGLQIDHIVTVAKCGKTIPSNLQVLCSKCNGAKKDKLI